MGGGAGSARGRSESPRKNVCEGSPYTNYFLDREQVGETPPPLLRLVPSSLLVRHPGVAICQKKCASVKSAMSPQNALSRPGGSANEKPTLMYGSLSLRIRGADLVHSLDWLMARFAGEPLLCAFSHGDRVLPPRSASRPMMPNTVLNGSTLMPISRALSFEIHSNTTADMSLPLSSPAIFQHSPIHISRHRYRQHTKRMPFVWSGPFQFGYSYSPHVCN